MRGIENDHRNVIQLNGYSSSQRATGRGCSDTVQLLDHTPVTLAGGESREVQRLLELKEKAREAYVQARSSRQLQAILHERVRAEPREFAVGEAVHYRRPWDGRGDSAITDFGGQAL